jgi:hypothetical protein
MKKNTQRGFAPLIILLLVLLVGGGAYAISKNKGSKANVNANATSTAATSTADVAATSTISNSDRTIQITLSEQNKSGQNGKAVITEVNGKAKVIVTLTGKPSAAIQPSHIHIGSCSTLGAVKYPLTSIDKGAAQTMLDISVDQLLAQLPLSVNVHKSGAEIGTYVACGEIGTSTEKMDKGVSASTTVKVKANVTI